MMSSIEDAERLVPWGECNTGALQDEAVEAAVLRALAVPVPNEYAGDLPLLRFANESSPIPLVDAVLNPPIPRGNGHRWFRCDVTGTKMREPNTLWIPCGRSVVQLTVRNSVRDLIATDTRCNLAWS